MGAAPLFGLLLAGLLTTTTLFMMMARTDIRKWLGYSNCIDVTFTVLLVYLFHDSFSGIVSAAFAGIFMSIGLWIARRLMGCKQMKFTGKQVKLYIVSISVPVLHWVSIPPRGLCGVRFKGVA